MINVKEFLILRSEALVSRKRAIAQDFKVKEKYYSPAADRYLEKLQEYGVYCREDKKDDWLRITTGLVNNIGLTQDFDWRYEAFLFENTAKMMELIHGEVDWNTFEYLGGRYTTTLVEDMTELLLEFSPNGVLFVDNVVSKYVDGYADMTRVRDMYNSLIMKDTKVNDSGVQFVKKSTDV